MKYSVHKHDSSLHFCGCRGGICSNIPSLPSLNRAVNKKCFGIKALVCCKSVPFFTVLVFKFTQTKTCMSVVANITQVENRAWLSARMER